MIIAWFTPFAAGTGVARFGALVAAALVELGHRVVVVRLDELDRPGERSVDEVLHWRLWHQLWAAERVFYTVGDDFAEYAPAFDLLRRKPGIAIFRDATLSGYFARRAAIAGLAEPRLDAADSLARIASEATAVVAGDDAVATILTGVSAGRALRLDPPEDAAGALAYAERLLAFALDIAATEPLLEASRQWSDRLADMGIRQGDPVIGRIAAAAATLFPATLPGREPSAQPDPL